MVDFISLKRGERRKISASSATLVMIMFTWQDLGLSLRKKENNHGADNVELISRARNRSRLDYWWSPSWQLCHALFSSDQEHNKRHQARASKIRLEMKLEQMAICRLVEKPDSLLTLSCLEYANNSTEYRTFTRSMAVSHCNKNQTLHPSCPKELKMHIQPCSKVF